MPHEQMKTLPIDHAQLAGLRFCGNGKNSEATIEFVHARRAVLILRYASMDLAFDGPVAMRTREHGDTEVVIEIAPAPGRRMILNEAAVCFDGEDDEWEEFLRRYIERQTLPWSVKLRLRVGISDTAKEFPPDRSAAL